MSKVKEIINHVKKRGLKDILNKEKRDVYMADKKSEKEGINIPAEDALAYAEQLVWRSISCPQCLEAGVCVGSNGDNGCGCNFLGLARQPDGECGNKVGNSNGEDDPLWDKMLPAKEWKHMKEEVLKFKFDVVSNNK